MQHFSHALYFLGPGFGSDADNPHLPHNHEQNEVVYTGTHDNDTVKISIAIRILFIWCRNEFLCS